LELFNEPGAFQVVSFGSCRVGFCLRSPPTSPILALNGFLVYGGGSEHDVFWCLMAWPFGVGRTTAIRHLVGLLGRYRHYTNQQLLTATSTLYYFNRAFWVCNSRVHLSRRCDLPACPLFVVGIRASSAKLPEAWRVSRILFSFSAMVRATSSDSNTLERVHRHRALLA